MHTVPFSRFGAAPHDGGCSIKTSENGQYGNVVEINALVQIVIASDGRALAERAVGRNDLHGTVRANDGVHGKYAIKPRGPLGDLILEYGAGESQFPEGGI